MLGAFFETVGRLGTAAEFFNRHSPSPGRLSTLALIRGNQKQLEQLSRTLAANSYIADPNLVFYLARSGLVDQAERILAELRSGTLVPGFLEAARGELAMARGRTAEAIHLLRKSQEQPRLMGRVAFWLGLETLASALARRGDLESAIRALEKGSQSKRLAVFHWGSNGAFWERNQLLLARLYRKAGRAPDAQRIEAELLKLLAVADPDHPLLLELQRLQSS
jgi:predicted Zn-dependent protease